MEPLTTPTAPILKPLMTIPTAAEFIGISTRSLHRLIDTHDIEVCAIGRTFFLKGSDVQRIHDQRPTRIIGQHGKWNTDKLGPRMNSRG